MGLDCVIHLPPQAGIPTVEAQAKSFNSRLLASIEFVDRAIAPNGLTYVSPFTLMVAGSNPVAPQPSAPPLVVCLRATP